MSEWVNSHAGLVTLGFVFVFVITMMFQRTRGGPV